MLGGNLDHKNITWVSWGIVYMPKEARGMGIRDLSKFNYALLGKWHWNLFHRQGGLWAQVLNSKYGGWRNLDETRRFNREFIRWRDLSFIFNLTKEGSWFNRNIKWKIGSGSKVLFWEDAWKEDEVSLKEKYPRLYQISQQQVQQMGITTNTGWEWQLQWRRFLLEAEIAAAANFMEDIQSLEVQMQQQDLDLGRGFKWEVFSGKCLYASQ